MGIKVTRHRKEVLDMAGVPRLTPDEIEAREERRREYTKRYYSKPEIKEKQKEYYKKYNQVPMNKEDHRLAQARYMNSQRGMITRAKYQSKPRQIKQDSNDYHDIVV